MVSMYPTLVAPSIFRAMGANESFRGSLRRYLVPLYLEEVHHGVGAPRPGYVSTGKIRLRVRKLHQSGSNLFSETREGRPPLTLKYAEVVASTL